VAGVSLLTRGSHRLHGSDDVWIRPGGYGSEQSRPEQNRLGFARQHEHAAGNVGVFTQKYLVFEPSPTGNQRLDLVALAVHLLNNVPHLISDGLDGREVQNRQVVDAR